MALSFFRALNPSSKDSGIVYSLAKETFFSPYLNHYLNHSLSHEYPCQGKEMIDHTVPEQVSAAFHKNLDYFAGLSSTYKILLGEHYDLSLKGRDDSMGGSKGALDYLIFPLIARKLIADTFLDERRENGFSNALAWIIAIPLELARFSAAIALTLLLAPVVALVHLFKAFQPDEPEEGNTHTPRTP